LIDTGDNLRATASELRTSEYIEDFFSGGPKIYGNKTVHTTTPERKTVCKIRGITLNYSTPQLVDFEVIKDMALQRTEMGHVNANTEKKNERNSNAVGGIIYIITEPEGKLYRIAFSRGGV